MCAFLVDDGQPCQKGDALMMITGSAASILLGERVALNFAGHLTGIATKTAGYVVEAKGTKARSRFLAQNGKARLQECLCIFILRSTIIDNATTDIHPNSIVRAADQRADRDIELHRTIGCYPAD